MFKLLLTIFIFTLNSLFAYSVGTTGVQGASTMLGGHDYDCAYYLSHGGTTLQDTDYYTVGGYTCDNTILANRHLILWNVTAKSGYTLLNYVDGSGVPNVNGGCLSPNVYIDTDNNVNTAPVCTSCDGDAVNMHCVPKCDPGFYRDQTTECAPIPTCEIPYQEFNTTSMQCEGTPPPQNPNCTACSDYANSRTAECLKFGAYVDGFTCNEDFDTCEVIYYDSGTCIDDDTNPNDPNYGDGSQNSNNNTDDIPDINNSTNSTSTTTTNSDGTSTTNTQNNYPDYNPAFETIGDNIADSTKAINAQTSANKLNTEYLGDKIDDLSKKFDSDGSTGYFDGFVENLQTVKSSYDNVFSAYSTLRDSFQNGFTFTGMQSGNCQGFTFDIYGKTVNLSLDGIAVISPIVAFFVNIILVYLSIVLIIRSF